MIASNTPKYWHTKVCRKYNSTLTCHICRTRVAHVLTYTFRTFALLHFPWNISDTCVVFVCSFIRTIKRDLFPPKLDVSQVYEKQIAWWRQMKLGETQLGLWWELDFWDPMAVLCTPRDACLLSVWSHHLNYRQKSTNTTSRTIGPIRRIVIDQPGLSCVLLLLH